MKRVQYFDGGTRDKGDPITDGLRFILVWGILVCGSMAMAQNGFDTVTPDKPVSFSQVKDGVVWVRGHWIPVDATDKKSALAGPSISEISCDRQSMTCTDSNAKIDNLGTMFA